MQAVNEDGNEDDDRLHHRLKVKVDAVEDQTRLHHLDEQRVDDRAKDVTDAAEQAGTAEDGCRGCVEFMTFSKTAV